MYVCDACIYVMYISARVYTYVRMYVCMHACMYVCARTQSCAYIHTLRISGWIPPLSQTPL